MAVFIVAGIASATDISACQDINTSGSYTLTTDLTSTGYCISIYASSVTFDGAGYTITHIRPGGGTANHANLRVISANNVIVKNYTSCHNSNLETDTVAQVTNSNNFEIYDTKGCKDGFGAITAGISVTNGTGMIAARNVKYNYITLSNVNDAIIANNTLGDEVGTAITISTANNANIYGNYLSGSSGCGSGCAYWIMNLNPMTNSIITNNTFLPQGGNGCGGNFAYSIYTGAGSGNEYSNNLFSNACQYNGLYFLDTNGKFNNNTMNYNAPLFNAGGTWAFNNNTILGAAIGAQVKPFFNNTVFSGSGNSITGLSGNFSSISGSSITNSTLSMLLYDSTSVTLGGAVTLTCTNSLGTSVVGNGGGGGWSLTDCGLISATNVGGAGLTMVNTSGGTFTNCSFTSASLTTSQSNTFSGVDFTGLSFNKSSSNTFTAYTTNLNVTSFTTLNSSFNSFSGYNFVPPCVTYSSYMCSGGSGSLAQRNTMMDIDANSDYTVISNNSFYDNPSCPTFFT